MCSYWNIHTITQTHTQSASFANIFSFVFWCAIGFWANIQFQLVQHHTRQAYSPQLKIYLILCFASVCLDCFYLSYSLENISLFEWQRAKERGSGEMGLAHCTTIKINTLMPMWNITDTHTHSELKTLPRCKCARELFAFVADVFCFCFHTLVELAASIIFFTIHI